MEILVTYIATLLWGLAQCKGQQHQSDLIDSVPHGHPSPPMATCACPSEAHQMNYLILYIYRVTSSSCALGSLQTYVGPAATWFDFLSRNTCTDTPVYVDCVAAYIPDKLRTFLLHEYTRQPAVPYQTDWLLVCSSHNVAHDRQTDIYIIYTSLCHL